ncbi:OLC1v1032547C1 [Oldenlandia corymbosa var. corymbosa]|uniref:OLC1v1032547C1 n=1 Tax=Oldenlandia corymbosa var. corymbosa TaxID=529605 RepID=A0AAV1CP56_OLDCO|nr:OLC1v1032547C1 [Oldenlandia corymbosa var. corymbosa]
MQLLQKHHHYSTFFLLFSALILGPLLLPLVILALIFLFLALVLLSPALCIFFLDLMLFKSFFKYHGKIPPQNDQNQEEFKQPPVCLEIDPSELKDLDPSYESEDCKNGIPESQHLRRHIELWETWNPQSAVVVHERKSFKELMSFWKRQETLTKQR